MYPSASPSGPQPGPITIVDPVDPALLAEGHLRGVDVHHGHAAAERLCRALGVQEPAHAEGLHPADGLDRGIPALRDDVRRAELARDGLASRIASERAQLASASSWRWSALSTAA